MPPVARVEPLTTARALRGPFDYRTDGLTEVIRTGSRLEIPFAGRRAVGVVTGIAEESELDDERLAAPTRVLEPALPADLVELALWMADEYCSTPARALQLVSPPPGRARTGLVARRTAAPVEGRVTDAQARILEALTGSGAVPAASVPGADHGALRRLERRGLVALERRNLPRRPRHVSIGAESRRPSLTRDQERVLAELESARPGERLLLHGVTGSGKTEIYLQACARVLAAGRSVIVLVPEIALTPQTVSRFVARLGETVAVLHSALGEGERFDEWMRLRSGEARVCVGPRSAVLAPVADLGLVIVDEEHEASYKHEGDPRYDARAIAEWRATRSGAVLLAGTATPRPEAWERLRRVSLPSRVDGRELPPVEVLDMREARHPLHPRTREALGEVVATGRKAIVLLNRRGWSNFLSCRSCGRVWECPECDVALVLHRASGTIACHHCGHSEPAPSRCDACGSVSVARHGAGTERLEHELAEALGGPVFRLDADAVSRKDGVVRLLSDFQAARSGILVGTQMVAKGHDFPDVTLGVVLDADQTLRFPDFRAEERTFALVAQLAGRAGRGPGGGRVLVQTFAPDAPSIVAASRHDAEGFLAGELGRRRALCYPPFATLLRVVCSAPGPVAAEAAAALAATLEPPGALVLGPAPLFRLRGRERSQVVVKAQDRAAAIAAVRRAVDALARTRLGRAVALSVDVDPQ